MFQWYYSLLSLSDLYDGQLGCGLEHSLLVYSGNNHDLLFNYYTLFLQIDYPYLFLIVFHFIPVAEF